MRTLLLLGMFFMLVGCINRGQELPVLNLEAAMNIGRSLPDTFSINDIVEVVDIVPIETRPDALIGSARMVHIGRDHYYVHHDNAISRINRDGKIVNTISRQGRGPGEYLYLNYAVVNEKNSTIRVFDMNGGKYIVYDLDGNLVEEGSLRERETGNILFVGDDYMVMSGSGNYSHRLYITDSDMNVRQSLFQIDTMLAESERRSLISYVGSGGSDSGALVNIATDDTLYLINKRGITPEAILRKGRYRRPDELFILNPPDIDPANPKYMLVTSVNSMGRDHYFITHLMDGGIAREIWSRDGELLAHTDSRDGAGSALNFTLTLHSGKTVTFPAIGLTGETLGFIFNAITVADALEGVGEEDNPVIVIAKLKK